MATSKTDYEKMLMAVFAAEGSPPLVYDGVPMAPWPL